MVLEVIVRYTAGTILYSVCECIRFVLFCVMLHRMYCIIIQFSCNTSASSFMCRTNVNVSKIQSKHIPSNLRPARIQVTPTYSTNPLPMYI